jgi:prepilin-type processing-associated H-X9-DG protein
MAENSDGPNPPAEPSIGTSGSFSKNGFLWARVNLRRHGATSNYSFADGHVEALLPGKAQQTSIHWSNGTPSTPYLL